MSAIGLTVSIPRIDWDFDKVPNSELATCCLWEYARESAHIRNIREQSAESSRKKLSFQERLGREGREFQRVFSALGRSAILFQEGHYGFGGDNFYSGFVSPFPRAWQSLSDADRAVLCETAKWDVNRHVAFPGFRRSYHPRVVGLAKLFRPKPMKEVFGGDGSANVAEFFHSGSKLRSICPNSMYRGGTEVLAVEIDWGKFTNEQLIAEFKQWLKENEPPGVVRPDKRGRKKIGDRVMLERLGIMRLLHRFVQLDLRDKCPLAWKRYNSPNRRWRKDIEAARNHFRVLFPFLPKNEVPLSWPPKDR